MGFDTSLKVVEVGLPYFRAAGDPRNHAQIGISGWAADYPTAANFFDLFSCASRDAPNSLNLSQFCSPALDREAAAAQAAEGPAAEQAWAAATRHLTQLAPAVAITTRQRTYFAAPRTGDVLQNPVFGVMLERAWVR